VREGQELPVGWAMATVGELTNVGPKNECADETEVGFVPLQRLGVTYLSRHTHEPRVWKEVKKGYTQFQNGDVLLARITPSFENGKAGIARDLPNGLGAGSTEYIVFRPFADALDPRYLLAHFKTRSFLTSGEMVMTGAVGQQRVPKAFVLESQLPLAPLNEQRRIAAKLDTTLAAVDACRQRLDGVAVILKRFRQAALAAATSGELTREWREERGQVFEWLDVQLGEHAESMNYGTSAKSQREGEVPVLRMGNLQGGELDWTELVYTSDLAEIAKYLLDDGDVLFNRTNSPELVGKTAIYRGERPAIYAGYLIRVRCRPSLDPEFLNLSLNSPAARDYCWRVKSDGVSQSNINAKKLAAYPILLPSVEEQEEIVRRAKELFCLADQLEARFTATRRIVDRLTPALLAKAFRGELVSQDPSDEPASVLLERIRAARPAEAAEGKPSRRGRDKAAASPEPNLLPAAPAPPNLLAQLLQECGALSERALLAASELDPDCFLVQLELERASGAVRETCEDGQAVLEAA
jgi:type I restriction enzyme, S subunit